MLHLQSKPLNPDLFTLLVGRGHVSKLLATYRLPVQLDVASEYLTSVLESTALHDVFAHYFPREWGIYQRTRRSFDEGYLERTVERFGQLVDERLFPVYDASFYVLRDERGLPVVMTPVMSQGYEESVETPDRSVGWQALLVLLGQDSIEETHLDGGDLAAVLATACTDNGLSISDFMDKLAQQHGTPLADVALMCRYFYFETGNRWLDADPENNWDYIALDREGIEDAAKAYVECQAMQLRVVQAEAWLAEPDNLRQVVEIWNSCAP